MYAVTFWGHAHSGFFSFCFVSFTIYVNCMCVGTSLFDSCWQVVIRYGSSFFAFRRLHPLSIHMFSFVCFGLLKFYKMKMRPRVIGPLLTNNCTLLICLHSFRVAMWVFFWSPPSLSSVYEFCGGFICFFFSLSGFICFFLTSRLFYYLSLRWSG